MGNERPLGRTVRVHGWRLATIMCAAALLSVLLGASNASAATANICVGPDPTSLCPNDWSQATDLADAASQASSSLSDLTNIYVTSGTYSSAAGVSFGNKQVKILGIGPTRPVVTIDAQPSYPADTSVLLTLGASKIDNIEIDLPTSSDLTGITAEISGPKISNVSIVGPNADNSTGIVVGGATPVIENTTMSLGSSSTGIFVDGSGNAILDDLNISHATTAIRADTAANFKIRRLVSHSKNGVESFDSSGDISSSLIMPSAVGAENSGGDAVSADTTAGTTNDIRVDNCTLIGGGTGTYGVTASASGALSVQSITADSSIIAGYQTASATQATSGGDASVDLAYSRYNGSVQGITNVAGTSQPTNEYGFVNAAGGNYALTLTSPLIDAGDPFPLNSNDSATDANDLPRVVSRGAGNIRDIGAYEVQNSAPVAKISIATSVPSTTSSTQFSAAGSTDAEGDSMTYDWKFDGAPGVSGVLTQKMFLLDGPHSVQLTVTDKTGASATTSQQFNVARGYLAIKLRSQNTTISKKGTFKITMSCPATAISNCTGRLLFQTTKKVNAKDYTKRPGWAAKKPDYLQAARYVFSIKPGTTQKLEVRTYSTFQNVLAVHKKFKIQSTLVSGTTSNANLTANRATFTVSAPKSKK